MYLPQNVKNVPRRQGRPVVNQPVLVQALGSFGWLAIWIMEVTTKKIVQRSEPICVSKFGDIFHVDNPVQRQSSWTRRLGWSNTVDYRNCMNHHGCLYSIPTTTIRYIRRCSHVSSTTTEKTGTGMMSKKIVMTMCTYSTCQTWSGPDHDLQLVPTGRWPAERLSQRHLGKWPKPSLHFAIGYIHSILKYTL